MEWLGRRCGGDHGWPQSRLALVVRRRRATSTAATSNRAPTAMPARVAGVGPGSASWPAFSVGCSADRSVGCLVAVWIAAGRMLGPLVPSLYRHPSIPPGAGSLESAPTWYAVQAAPGSADQYDQYEPLNVSGHGSGAALIAQIMPEEASVAVNPALVSACRPVAGSPAAQPTSTSPPTSVKSTTTVTPDPSVHAPTGVGTWPAVPAAAVEADNGTSTAVNKAWSSAVVGLRTRVPLERAVGEGPALRAPTVSWLSREVRADATIRAPFRRPRRMEYSFWAGFPARRTVGPSRLTVAGQRRTSTGFPWRRTLERICRPA